MIVANKSSAPTRIVHVRDEEPQMMTNESLLPTQCDKFNSNPPNNAVWFKPPERRNEQMDRPSPV